MFDKYRSSQKLTTKQDLFWSEESPFKKKEKLKLIE